VVIMFELTGALTYILPTMIVVGVTKAVADRCGKGGIADRMIWFNGFPFLDNKDEHTFGVPVSQTMTANPRTLPATGLTIRQVERILAENKFQGFPVVEDEESNILLGYIGRTELRYAMDRAKRDQHVSLNARCFFGPHAGPRSAVTPSATMPAVSFDDMAETAGQMSVDFSKFVDPTPLAVHPRLPLETVMELFKKLGPRVILVEHRGRLTGLVTIKDCLKYQFQVEAQENPKDDSGLQAGQERVWEGLRGVAGWIREKLGRLGGGRLRLASDIGSPRVSDPPSSAGLVDRGREEEGTASVELDDRANGS
jgi:chloride channel 3/4/5